MLVSPCWNQDCHRLFMKAELNLSQYAYSNLQPNYRSDKSTWRLARRFFGHSQVELHVIQQHVTHFSIFEPAALALF